MRWRMASKYLLVLIAGIAVAFVARHMLDNELPDVEYHEVSTDGETLIPVVTEETPEASVSEARMSQLPWLVWHGSAPALKSLGRELTCGTASCVVRTQQEHTRPPLHANTETRVVMMYGSGVSVTTMPLPRPEHQMWALMHEESPKNNAMFSHDDLITMFNITATYRQGSDFPLTLQFLPGMDYLRREPVPVAEKNLYRQGDDGLAAVAYVQSTCSNPAYRDVYVKKLMQHIRVDALGKCLNNRKLPEKLQPTSEMFSSGFYDVLRKYKFVVAFENGICDDYITEKFWRPLHLGTVPIYRGAPNIKEWLPSNKSALVYGDFESPEALADLIKYLDSNDTAYNEYFDYKKGPQHITNEKLKTALQDRPYNAYNHQENERLFYENFDTKPNFIDVFECLVCKRVHERLELEKRHSEQGLPPPDPWIANSSHFGCPAPEEWRPEFAEVEQDSGVNWNEDYQQGARNALSIKKMLLAKETDSSKAFNNVYMPIF